MVQILSQIMPFRFRHAFYPGGEAGLPALGHARDLPSLFRFWPDASLHGDMEAFLLQLYILVEGAKICLVRGQMGAAPILDNVY